MQSILHITEREACVHFNWFSQSFLLQIFFVKTDLPFLCIINKNAACVLLFKTKTKYLLKNSISLPLRKRERGYGIRKVHRYILLDSRPHSSRNRTLSPAKPGDTQPSQPAFSLSQGSLPCREEALQKELEVWERKRKSQGFLQKSLLRHSG